MAAPKEELIWKGSPSQVLNLLTHLVCLLATVAIVALFWILRMKPLPFPPALILAALLVPVAFAVWKVILTRSHFYEITSERLKTTVGLFSRRTDELELYRVRDTTLVQPFVYRVFGTGNIVLSTTDASSPQVVIECIPQAAEIRESLRNAIEACRDRKRARLTELSGVADPDLDRDGL